jgi:hypothetical protein
MEINLEALRNGDISQHNVLFLSENIEEKTLKWEKLFCCGKHSGYCRRGVVCSFLELQKHVFCITISDFRNLTFKVVELTHSSSRTE